ncbi:MAG: IPT/TIG domain-containing protein [Vicinamibacterales bacterium]
MTRRAAPLVVALLAVLVLRGHLSATNHDTHIKEILVGANGDSRIQFIIVEQGAVGQNLWGPQGGETQSRAMLVFFDATGRETGKFKFPTSPPTGGTLKTLVATQDFATLPGAPAPDVIIPPLLNPISGKVCLKHNPANVVFVRNECVSYGAFSGDTETNVGSAGPVAAGSPAASGGLPIVNTVSLRRTVDTGRNADFLLTSTPTPTNIAGATFSIPVSPQITQGANLFNNETFSGNGRTCASCHLAGDSLRLSSSSIQSRFATVASTFDPLFIAETKPSAFDAGADFNLNTLVLAGEVTSNAPCSGELRGIVTTQNGSRANVLTRVSPTTYLVYGGKTPGLTGTVSDSNSCAGTVASIASGSLGTVAASAVLGLEDPRRMRNSAPGLILENIDGFSNPPVFRKSPHLLNLSRTAPFGFSGNIPDLQTFATGAVLQHFPRTLARNPIGANPDFRLPTPDELAAMEAFLLAQEFPSGDDPNKFDLHRFATTSAQRLGRASFFGNSSDPPGTRCGHCHGGGPALSQTMVSFLGKPVGVNASFNTGVANNVSASNALPCEPSTATVGACGSREFSLPALFNIKNLTPLFHNGSAQTIFEAVNFYNTSAFRQSPAGRATQLIFDSFNIGRFLEGLVVRPYVLSEGPVRFGPRGVAAGATPGQTITITNTSSSPITFFDSACQLTGPNPNDFIIQSCPLAPSLAPGQSKTIQVAFDPISNGLKTAILEINAPDPSGIDLFGVGGSLTAAPVLLAVTPASGQANGGDSVTITGANFASGATVTIGGVRAGFVSVVNSTTITARTGAHAVGAVDVVVTNPDGQTQTLSSGFTYTPPLPLTVTSITPNSDSSLGRATVTIGGTGFTNRTTVSIGGVAATNVTMVTGTVITAATAAHGPGTVDVTVRNPDGQTSTLPNSFTFVGAPPPTVASVAPASGSSVGGSLVTIGGTGFENGTTVTVGGVPASIVFNGFNATSLRVVTGPHSPGPVDVVVTNSDGQAATRSNGFAYTNAAAPTISSISPSSGSSLGGTTVFVSGTGFASGATVTIGGVSAPVATAISSSGFLFATTGAHATGTVDIVVTNPDGQSATRPGGFVYTAAPPSVTSIEPSSGPTGGGTAITITGTNFAAGATVVIDSVNATSVVFVNSTTMTATTAAHGAGTTDIVVTNPDAQLGRLQRAFVYGSPTVTAVTPASGPITGGTTLTITGADFVTGDIVTIGGVAATSVLVVNLGTITATTSAHAAGVVDVVVTNNGQGGAQPNSFTYFNPVLAPTVTGIAPTSGPTAGGTPVTITGTNFVTGATVALGGVAAINATVVNATTITATTGPHAAGIVDVVVTNADTQRGTRASSFTYVPPPVVASVVPLSGPMAGGTSVTITGSNFAAGATVAIGGVPAAGVVVVDATTITATTGAHAAGLVNVVVTNPDAQSGTRVNSFRYFNPLLAPTVMAITPASGPTSGGTSVTVTGTNFVAGATVAIGGLAATAPVVVNATRMTATTGAHAAGTFDVAVTNTDTQVGILQNSFTFVLPPPTVTAILPAAGSTQGSTSVTITGTNFVSGATVTIGGVAATNVQVTNATTITAATAPHAAEGGVSVVVTNADTQVATLLNAFTYGQVGGYTFTTLAGSSGGFGSADGTGTAARFFNPGNASVDSAGNVYVADTTNHVIRKITASGDVTTLAGSAGNAGSADGTGSAARFNSPLGVAVDASFNVLVADTANHTIRKITPAGVVTTLAGLAGTPGSADAVFALARFSKPSAIAVDGAGNIFIADTENHTIRRIFAGNAGTNTMAGLAGVPGSANGFGTAARFNKPQGIAVDNAGNVYVADTGNHVLRKITGGGNVGSLAGTAGSAGTADGQTSSARFNSPQSLTVDHDGTIFVADTLNHTIRMVTPVGAVSTLAGLAGSAGRAEGTGTDARFNAPAGVAIDATGNLYITDTSNHALRKMTMSTEVVTTLAGSPSNGSIDNTTAAALFASPSSVAVDGSGTVYIADTFNHTIRKITPGGIVTTLAGSAGNSGSADGTGSAARFFLPSGIAVDAAGTVVVADTSNHTIRTITSAGVVTTLAGLAGTKGSADGTGSAARFNFPNAVAVDGSGTVFVADTVDHTIRKITSSGVVTTLAGSVGNFGSADGTGSAARFVYPAGVAVDGSGTVFVADTDSHTIRKITSAGVVTTLAGVAGTGGSADGTGTAARFTFPFGVAVDGAGNVFVADAGNHTIRQITPAGVVSTIGGLAGTSGSADGTGTEARFFLPTSVTVESTGTLYVADALNNSIRRGEPPPGGGSVTTSEETASAMLLGPQRVAAAANAVRTAPPFGQVDTPVQGATGLTGTIAISGWALDDAGPGVAGVKVYRNCVTFENQANCQTLGGANVAYLGDATFVAGARPDVEAAFPAYPGANRAGWAYVLLTNTLPHVPGEGLVGGQGTFTLFVYATDLEGNVTLLGRAPVDHTPTTIAVDNDRAVAPFGWIDTPAENATVSGTVNVSGWAATPDDGRGVMIPPTGSAFTLFVDGVATSVPVMVQTGNPSRYRNLDAGGGAIAVASLDTTPLSNGPHTISWNVTDSAGRSANVGTRSLLVQNGGVSSLANGPAEARAAEPVLNDFAAATGVVWGRAGFDVESPLDVIVPDANGVLQMQIPVMGRVELRLGSVDAGYLVANGSLRDLPPGSRIDPATGTFSWAPGPAYLGTYRLEFLQGGAHLPVDVTTRPSGGAGGIRVGLDGPAEIISTGPVTISGWAVDLEASTGSGVDAVHVYAYRRNSVAAPIFLGAARLDVSRPDVAQAFGPTFGQAGFSLATTLAPGDYDLRGVVFLQRSGQSEDVRSVHVTIR